jgi:hypothetical protein
MWAREHAQTSFRGRRPIGVSDRNVARRAERSISQAHRHAEEAAPSAATGRPQSDARCTVQRASPVAPSAISVTSCPIRTGAH